MNLNNNDQNEVITLQIKISNSSGYSEITTKSIKVADLLKKSKFKLKLGHKLPIIQIKSNFLEKSTLRQSRSQSNLYMDLYQSTLPLSNPAKPMNLLSMPTRSTKSRSTEIN